MRGQAVGIRERFGIRSAAQVARDVGWVIRDGVRGKRFQFDVRSVGILRPELSLPAYSGRVPRDGLAPVFNLFDRTGGGRYYSQRVSRRRCRDFRGGRLTYDEHDGTDFVCPVGTPLVAAAPGVVVMIRDRWLRGGLTLAVDHGHGLVTQYTHCSRALVELGQPVARGEPVALSGSSGFDMVQFFPWVPPHIHFMVWVNGRPRDPFLAPGESASGGSWLMDNTPAPSGPLRDDATDPQVSAVDEATLQAVAEACLDPHIEQEIARVQSKPWALAALLEDALHHDRYAFPAVLTDLSLRPAVAATTQRLTLPLPASDYRGMRLADSRWTIPNQAAACP